MAFCPKPCKARKVPTIQGSNFTAPPHEAYLNENDLRAVYYTGGLLGNLKVYYNRGCWENRLIRETRSDIPDFGSWNDRALSYQCDRGSDWRGFSHENYKGRYAHFVCDNLCHHITDKQIVSCGSGDPVVTESACSRTCGGGTKTVTKRETRPNPAEGLLSSRVPCPVHHNTVACNEQPCPTTTTTTTLAPTTTTTTTTTLAPTTTTTTTPAPTTPSPYVFTVRLKTSTHRFAGVGGNLVKIQFQSHDGLWSDESLVSHKGIQPGEDVAKTFTTAGCPQALRLINRSRDGYVFDRITIEDKGSEPLVVAQAPADGERWSGAGPKRGWGTLLSKTRTDWAGAKESLEFPVIGCSNA